VAGLVTGGNIEQLEGHLALAKTNGLTETEFKEVHHPHGLLRRMAPGRLRHDRRQARLRRLTPTHAEREARTITAASPLITRNNGVKMPALGLGVYQSPPDETTDAVLAALHQGYRLIDTAAAYPDERQVGKAIARSGIDRSEILVETKLWITDYGYESARHGFDVSLRKLGIEQLDLWLLHQPLPSDFEKTIAAYKAAEKLVADGRVRAIGVLNQTPAELDELFSRTDVVPAVNQIQVHPYYTQPEWRKANDRHGIQTQCWSPSAAPIYGGAETTPSRTRSSPTSPPSSPSPPPRSFCAGTSTTASRRSRVGQASSHRREL
jgi:diketogulonate reductase-like aldo/keto reductase